MTKKSLLYTICAATVAAVATTSCQSSYKINGSIELSVPAGNYLYLAAFEEDEQKILDSCEVVHGNFSFEGTVDSVKFAMIESKTGNFLPVFLEKGEIKVAININESIVSGTELNDKFSDFRKKLTNNINAISELERKENRGIMNGVDMDSLHAALTKENIDLIVQRDTLTSKFITNNFDNPLAAAAFQYITMQNMMLGQIPTMSAWFEAILSKANDRFKNDAFVKTYIKDAKNLEGMMNGTIETPTDQPANNNQPNEQTAGEKNPTDSLPQK